MKTLRYILAVVILVVSGLSADAQVDKKDVRRGNRDFKKENYREADIDYRKALLKDSTSVAANYNLASVQYRQGDMEQAGATLDRIKETAPATESSADYWYNRGDVALGVKDYQTAVDAFAKSLMIRPGDMDAKENYIYAKKKLEDQQNQQNQDNQDQNKQDNQDQNNDQNQDQNNDQNQDDQNDQNKDNDQNDQNKDQNNNQNKDSQGQEPKITPQAAQQMLQAIQAKEKETQDKVNKQKAEVLKSRQKDKNW